MTVHVIGAHASTTSLGTIYRRTTRPTQHTSSSHTVLSKIVK